jgi:chorismate lyase/3-hydroxybenzoate synthase
VSVPETTLTKNPEVQVPRLPAWAHSLAGRTQETDSRTLPELEVSERGGHRLISLSVPDCRDIPSAVFAARVQDAYRHLYREQQGFHPIRLWNFIPDITRPSGEGLNRYMVFNDSRRAALLETHMSEQNLQANLCAATAVGHGDDMLVLHCLASKRPSRPLENPRQIPSWRYSPSWGPTPPSFARATATPLESNDYDTLLIAGTASILGENSLHPKDPDKQIREILANLASLIGAAAGEKTSTALRRLTHLRVYRHTHIEESRIREALALQLEPIPGVAIEHCLATLCRPELLTEIEGCARLGYLPDESGATTTKN